MRVYFFSLFCVLVFNFFSFKRNCLFSFSERPLSSKHVFLLHQLTVMAMKLFKSVFVHGTFASKILLIWGYLDHSDVGLYAGLACYIRLCGQVKNP